MLEPFDRRHLLEALQPPDGYDLSEAVGTTYSLDLMILLTVPLAFAMSAQEEDAPNPLALLEAVRRYVMRRCILLITQPDLIHDDILEKSILKLTVTLKILQIFTRFIKPA
ncbi:hypothetical protein P4C99_17570 [Pontiellaceae bacterium B1224]|nr:hypothetical protein [Pontiellaceae bacterium B1224]